MQIELTQAVAADRDEQVVATNLEYLPGQQVVVRVRRREHRYRLDDRGAAVRLAGRPPRWRAAAEHAAAEHGLNLDRAGTVFVAAVAGRDLDALAALVALASRDVFLAVLELED